MNTLLVGYDLNTKGQKYEELIEFLKGHDGWWHHLDSTWLVRTVKTAKQLRDEIRTKKFVDDNDELLVIDVTGDSAAWHGFSKKGSEWLEKHL